MRLGLDYCRSVVRSVAAGIGRPSPFRFFIVFAVCAGCSGNAAVTEVLVTIDADRLSRSRAAQLEVRVFDTEGNMVRQQRVTLKGDDREASFVATVPLAPADETGTRRYRVEADLIDSESMLVASLEASGNYVADQLVTLPLRFDERCNYRQCPRGFTCEPVDCPDRNRCLPSRCVAACYDDQYDRAEPARAVPCADPPSLTGVFVDSGSGSDENACDNPDTPCETIEVALARFVETGTESTVFIAGDGNRYAGFSVRESFSGSVETPLWITAWPGRDSVAPIIDGAGREQVIFVAARDLVIEGLDVSGSTAQGININRIGDGSSERVVVRANRIHNNGTGENMQFFNSGITLVNGAKNNLVVGNVIHDNTRDDDSGAAPGIWIFVEDETRPGVSGNQVIGNRLVGNQAHGLQAFNTDVVTRFNFSTGNGGFGFFAHGGAEVASSRDVACSNGSAGWGVEGATATVARCTATGNAHGIEVAAEGSLTARRNIFVDNNGFGLFRDAPTTDTVTHEANLYSGNGSGTRSGGTSEADSVEGDAGLEEATVCAPFPSIASPGYRANDDSIFGAL